MQLCVAEEGSACAAWWERKEGSIVVVKGEEGGDEVDLEGKEKELGGGCDGQGPEGEQL